MKQSKENVETELNSLSSFKLKRCHTTTYKGAALKSAQPAALRLLRGSVGHLVEWDGLSLMSISWFLNFMLLPSTKPTLFIVVKVGRDNYFKDIISSVLLFCTKTQDKGTKAGSICGIGT